jgi:hypothetical protein
MHVHLKTLAPLCLLAAGLAAACDVSIDNRGLSVDLVTGLAESDERRTYAIATDGLFEVENRSGAIEIGAWDEPGIEVTIERRAKARSDEAAKALLAQIEILEEAGPGRVRLATSAPRDGSIEVNYRVRAPRSIATVMTNESGSVRITGMAGPIRASLSNGAITGAALAGAIEANSVNGPVIVDLAAVGGAVNLATVNGPVRITIPSTAKAIVSARTVNGRIATEGLSFEDLSQKSRRELEGRLNGGGPRIQLETTNGPVVINGKEGPS